MSKHTRHQYSKLLHEIFHHPHSTTGGRVGAENCLVCLGAIATHTETVVKATIEDERQQAAAATRKIFNMLPIDTGVEAALVADRLARHDETVAVIEAGIEAGIEAAVKGKKCLTCGIAGGHKSGCYELQLNALKSSQAALTDKLRRVARAMDMARRESASEPASPYARSATIILNAALAALTAER